MKTLITKLILGIFLTCNLSVSGQMKVLYVDDSDDTFGNAELFAAALDSAGYSITYFNAVDSAASPTDLVMEQYDLVVWMTSSDGGGLQLWNGVDEDNASLEAYLDGGGKLWIVGNDFLFDKYGTPAVTFKDGEFMSDYAGIKSYDAQAYGSDGNIGVASAELAPDSGIPDLPNLTWQFATLWWADAVTLKEGVKPVYLMGGGATYPLKVKVMATLYKNDTFEVLTYFFDISLVNNFSSLVAAVKPVMVHFEGIVSSVHTPLISEQKINVFPNPIIDNQFTLDVDLNNVSTIHAQLYNSQGKLVKNIFNNQSTQNLENQNIINLEGSLNDGLYFLQLNLDGKQQVTKPLLLLNAN